MTQANTDFILLFTKVLDDPSSHTLHKAALDGFWEKMEKEEQELVTSKVAWARAEHECKKIDVWDEMTTSEKKGMVDILQNAFIRIWDK